MPNGPAGSNAVSSAIYRHGLGLFTLATWHSCVWLSAGDPVSLLSRLVIWLNSHTAPFNELTMLIVNMSSL